MLSRNPTRLELKAEDVQQELNAQQRRLEPPAGGVMRMPGRTAEPPNASRAEAVHIAKQCLTHPGCSHNYTKASKGKVSG